MRGVARVLDAADEGGLEKKPFCQKEIRQALSLKKRILFVHEDDRKQVGFSEFYEMRDEAPEDLQYLFKEVESIRFERGKQYLVDAMLKELGERVCWGT